MYPVLGRDDQLLFREILSGEFDLNGNQRNFSNQDTLQAKTNSSRRAGGRDLSHPVLYLGKNSSMHPGHPTRYAVTRCCRLRHGLRKRCRATAGQDETKRLRVHTHGHLST